MATSPPLRLTPALHQQIVAAIRAGGFPHIAAQAFGVPVERFNEWLKRGRAKAGREPYRSFARAVEQAHAQSRLKAEVDVLQGEPKIWLEHGPGRDRIDCPGWSTAVKPALDDVAVGNVLMDADAIELLNLLMKLLEPFPDVRQRFAQALNKLDLPVAA